MVDESQEIQSLITDEMRRVIGVESAPAAVEIERDTIRRVANLLNDTNPLWRDEKYAKSTSYGGVIASPIFLHPSARANPAPTYESPYGGGLPAGDEWEFYEPVRPGDTLTMTMHIADFTERIGRRGQVLLTTTQTTFRNQHGRIAMIVRRIGVSYPRKSED